MPRMPACRVGQAAAETIAQSRPAIAVPGVGDLDRLAGVQRGGQAGGDVGLDARSPRCPSPRPSAPRPRRASRRRPARAPRRTRPRARRTASRSRRSPSAADRRRRRRRARRTPGPSASRCGPRDRVLVGAVDDDHVGALACDRLAAGRRRRARAGRSGSAARAARRRARPRGRGCRRWPRPASRRAGPRAARARPPTTTPSTLNAGSPSRFDSSLSAHAAARGRAPASARSRRAPRWNAARVVDGAGTPPGDTRG